MNVPNDRQLIGYCPNCDKSSVEQDQDLSRSGERSIPKVPIPTTIPNTFCLFNGFIKYNHTNGAYIIYSGTIPFGHRGDIIARLYINRFVRNYNMVCDYNDINMVSTHTSVSGTVAALDTSALEYIAGRMADAMQRHDRAISVVIKRWLLDLWDAISAWWVMRK